MKKWLKKAFHKFIINENGAVSIYAIMITLLLFIFNAVLIDYVRIMAAERKLDQAVKAAARSTMSSFDKSMMGSYGLFGFKGDEADIFEKVVREHLDTGAEDYFKFAEARYVDDSASVSFNSDMMVASKDTFEYQILEDMKYKAPLEIGESLLEGFLSISNEMKQASQFVDVAAEVQNEVDARDEDVKKARDELEKAQNKIEPLEKKFEGASSRVSVYPNVNGLSDVATHIEKYLEDKEKVESESEQDDGNEDESNKEANDNIKKFKESTANVLKKLDTDLKSLNKHLLNAEKALQEAQEHNDKALALIEDPPSKNFYDNASQAHDSLAEGSSVDSGDAGEGLENGIDALRDLIVEDQFFDNVYAPLEDAIYETSTTRGGNTLFNFLKKQVEAIENDNVENTLLTLTNVGVIEAKINEFIKAKESIRKAQEEALKIPKTDEDPETIELENESENEFKQAKRQLEELVGFAVDFKDYDELLKKATEYSEFAESEANSEELNTESKEELADSSMDIVDIIFSSIGDVLINQRDKAYLNEYIMMRFSHHDFNSRGAKAFGSTEAEIEYIIYGLNAPQVNVATALAEIFAIRFAVNLIEAFTLPQTYVSPNVFLSALRYAFAETFQDLLEISKGKKFSFMTLGNSNIQVFRTGYGDYLRLFLFVHPNGNKIQRTLARIDQKTGNDLKEMPTYISGEAEATVSLWFLPGVTDFLGNAGILDGNVKNGEFIIRKKTTYSY